MESAATEIRCLRCGYVWRSKAKLIKVSCPNCGFKNPNPSPRFAGVA